MPTWSFVRHGESQANAERWFAGSVDTPLTKRGEAQAIAARPQLMGLAIDRVLSSDLSRAKRTAELLINGSGLHLEMTAPQLRERACGDWEHRQIDEIEAAGDMPVFRSWTGRPPGGESLRDVAERVLRFLSSTDDGRHTLVVAHGALIRSVIGVIDGTSPEEIGLWKPANCELVTRELERGEFQRLLIGLR